MHQASLAKDVNLTFSPPSGGDLISAHNDEGVEQTTCYYYNSTLLV